MRLSIAAVVVPFLLTAPVVPGHAQQTTEAFELYGCGTASCHTIQGRLVASPLDPRFDPPLSAYSLFVDRVVHTFLQRGYVSGTPTGGGVVAALPDGTPLEPWVEIVSGCGLQPAGSTCTIARTEQGFLWAFGTTTMTRPVGSLHIASGFVTAVIVPADYSLPPGVFFPRPVPGDGSRVETVQLALVTPEPGTWALLGTGLLALAGVAHRRRRAA